MDNITAGETTPNSSWGGSGLSGIKSSGFREVGLICSFGDSRSGSSKKFIEFIGHRGFIGYATTINGN
jgi:hypothetical protein